MTPAVNDVASAIACDGDSIGAIRYNTTSAAFEGCNGAAWADIRTGATGTPAGANTQIQFNSAGAFGASANFNWDNANGRLGIGTVSPTYPLTMNLDLGFASGENTLAAFGRSVGNFGAIILGYEANGTTDTGMFLRSSNGVPFYLGTSGAPQAITILNGGDVGIGTGATAPGALLDIGKATAAGSMRIEGNTSGYVQLQTAAAAGSWTMTLPASAGTNGYVLSTNGSGVTSWVANGGGGATGSDTQVAFNDGGTESGTGNLTYTKGTTTLAVPVVSATTKVSLGLTAGAAAPGSNIGAAVVATSEKVNNVAYGDATTVGPAVTMTTGTTAIVTLTSKMTTTTAAKACAMGFAVSGASAIAAADTQALMIMLTATTDYDQFSATFYVTGLTAGSNTFTAKYKDVTTANVCSFANRNIVVMLP